jgi:hypothetical protein
MEHASPSQQGAAVKEQAAQGSPPNEPPDDGGGDGGDGGEDLDAPAPAVVETDPTKRYIRVRGCAALRPCAVRARRRGAATR